MRRKGKAQLVTQHLERISRRVLEDYSDVIREFVRGRHGIYALYRKDRLYRVGLTQNLRGRLNGYLRGKHAKRWDHFSIYFTLRLAFMKELESLVLRIATPRGNEVSGHFVRSENLRRALSRRITEDLKKEKDILLGIVPPRRKASKQDSIRRPGLRRPVLASYLKRRTKLRWIFKGRTYKARVGRDGYIRFSGKVFSSPSIAASAVTHRAMNGWTCWRYQRGPGEWVLLDTLRK